MMKLRAYQEEAKKRVLSEYEAGVTRQLVMLPTGCGKTPLFLSVLADLDGVSMVIAPNDQICSQIKESALSWIPGCKPCFLKESGSADGDYNLFIATNQMAYRDKRLDFLKRFNIKNLVIDEAHHSPAITDKENIEKTGTYRKIIKEINPEFILGVTATPCRLDGLGMGEIFQKLIYQKNIPEMIEMGYLCPLKCFEIYTKVNIDKAFLKSESEKHNFHKTRMDDDEEAEKVKPINQKELRKAIETSERNKLIVEAYKEKAGARKHTIAFCLSCDHAIDLAKMFSENNVPAEAITYETSQKDRDAILTRFAIEETKVITNFNVLTEGFDFPAVDCILMTRPTKSHTLYTQCVGRGTRIYEGKENCLVLDFRDDCHAKLVCFAGMETRQLGENPYDKLSKDEAHEAQKVESKVLYKSDGSLVFEEKEVAMYSEDWMDRPATWRQIRDIKNNIDSNINFDMLTRGEASKLLSRYVESTMNMPLTDGQKRFLSYLKINGHLNMSYAEIERLTKHEAYNISESYKLQNKKF